MLSQELPHRVKNSLQIIAAHDSLKRDAEFGNVPFSVAKLTELAAERIFWRDCGCVAKGSVCEADGQIGIEHQDPSRTLSTTSRVNIEHGNSSGAPRLILEEQDYDLARGPR
jgi:hypothetical protein